jgi:hypothetical protein
MGQSLELSLDAKSNVTGVVDRAKQSISELEKRASSTKAGSTTSNAAEAVTSKASNVFESQLSKVGKSFGNTVSSAILSFAGPMALIGGIVSFVGNSIEEARQLAKDGLELITKADTKGVSMEERRMANFFKEKEARENDAKKVAAGKIEITERFLRETEEGRKLGRGRESFSTTISHDPKIQKMALDAFLNSPEGKSYKGMFETSVKPTEFRTPDGLNNVVGVGANPVLQAMSDSLAESRKQTSLLEDIANGGKKVFVEDFTKKTMRQSVDTTNNSNL